MSTWTIKKEQYYENTCDILSFLLEEYSRIFGREIMYKEPCLIYNDKNAPCPRFNISPMYIRLHQQSFNFWSQTIYQLSHELCHYAMHQAKRNKEIWISWFEEIVCEAMSLYALEYATYYWYKCKLCTINPEFYKSNAEYLGVILAEPSTDGFQKCNTIGKLREYEQNRYSESRRETHARERKIIYAYICANPIEARCLLDYEKYVNSDKLTINFDAWIRDNPCSLVCALARLQPVKI